MAGELFGKIGEHWVAARKVVQRGVAGVAGITMLLRPTLAGAVVFGEGADGVSQFLEVEAEVGFIERRGEERAHGGS